MTKHDKIKLLYETFSEKKELSTSEIMQLLNLRGKSSVANYIHYLEDYGIHTSKYSGKNGEYFYTIEPDSTSPEIYLSLNIWRKFIIASFLQEKPLTKTQLWKCYDKRGKYNDYTYGSNDSRDISLGIERSSFDKLRDELIDAGDIVIQDKHLYLTGKNIPIVMPLTEQALIDQMNQLASIPANEPFKDTLTKIYLKHCLLYLEDYSPSSDNFICYGKTYLDQQQITALYGKLQGISFDKYQLSIHYQSKKGTRSALFSTGLIIYSVEKNKVYLLGYAKGHESDFLMIINLDTITDILVMDIPNKHYQSQEFKNIYKEMFSISIEPLVHVKVLFPKLPHIDVKLKNLHMYRKSTSTLQYTDDSIIYEDDLRGIHDFRNYLRGFGNNYTLLEPAESVADICENLQQQLSIYEDLLNEQV